MNKTVLATALVFAIGAAALAWSWRGGNGGVASGLPVESAIVERGEFAVHSAHDGVVESRRVITISSRFQGAATLVELAEEGRRAEAGEVLARFDASEIRTRIMKLEKDLVIARAELESLTSARLPLELKELELEHEEARRKLEAEQRYLEDSIALEKDNMVSAQEVQQQRRKVGNLEAEVDRAKLAYELTRDYLHPAELAKARTAVFSAEQSLELAREQLASSEIRAPADGVVVYKPLTIGSEFRRVRIGDSIYPNQPFMVLPDMTDLVVVIDVPEAELQTIEMNAAVVVQPVAYPHLRLGGHVEHVGAVAQSVPGKPDWQKFFHVVIGMDQAEPRVRPGMSVIAQVLSYHAENALLVPRRAVTWNDNAPRVRIDGAGGVEIREVRLGRANLRHYEVHGGLAAGERVLLN